MDQDATWYGGRPRPRRHFVRWGLSSPPQNGAEPPLQFSAHVYCGQTARWIKMPLGTEVNVESGDVVLDGVAAPPKRGTAPSFRSMSIVPNGWMDEDATWYASRPRPRPHCIRRNPSSPKRAQQPPSFRPMSIVATVAHLSYC